MDRMNLTDNDKILIKQIATEVSQAHQASCPVIRLIELKLGSIEAKVDKLAIGYEELNTKLFVGNGKEAWATRLDRLEQKDEKRKTNSLFLWTTVISIWAIIIGEGVYKWFDTKTTAPVAATAPATLAKTP